VVAFGGVDAVLARSQRLNRENVHSRAYIAFKTEELVAKFSREYDGHVFKDKAGLCLPVSMLVACDGRDFFIQRERIAGRGRVCTVSEVTSGQEKGRREECYNRSRHVVIVISSAPPSPDHPIQTRNTSLFYSPSKPLQPSLTMQTNSWRC
jgi:hypothetical protein